MRVISGTAKGRRLKMVPGDTTRPIMDRVKENLFNILGDSVRHTRWLDLFAGTGQIGIEALSRGAAEVVFVDNSRAAVRTVQQNLALTGLAERAAVQQGDAFAYLAQVRRASIQSFDVIYVAPPQYLGLWLDVMKTLAAEPAAYLQPDGRLIVQIDPKEYGEESFPSLTLADQRRYGRTLLLFYELDDGK